MLGGLNRGLNLTLLPEKVVAALLSKWETVDATWEGDGPSPVRGWLSGTLDISTRPDTWRLMVSPDPDCREFMGLTEAGTMVAFPTLLAREWVLLLRRGEFALSVPEELGGGSWTLRLTPRSG